MHTPPNPANILFSIDTFQVIKSIGKGGMGEVFLAYDLTCKRNVALKKIRMDFPLSSSRCENFFKEAYFTCQLTHPSIMPIYTIGEINGQIYYTMPYIESLTLKDVFTNALKEELNELPPSHRSSLAHLIPLFLQVCHAVAYAHEKGFIHRDLKPSNIFTGLFGDVYLSDWGLIDILKTNSEANASPENPDPIEKIEGSLAYISPEVALGQQPHAQSEIYALGLILYQMLTLRYPFHRSNSPDYINSIDYEVLIKPEDVAPHRHISPLLSKIAQKCLANDVNERYQSVSHLIADLQTYLYQPLPLSSSCESGESNHALKTVAHSLDTFQEQLKLSCVSLTNYLTDENEESRYFEMAYQLFPRESLPTAMEKKLFALTQKSLDDHLESADLFSLIVLQNIPPAEIPTSIKNYFTNRIQEMVPLYFINHEELSTWHEDLQFMALAIRLAFWLEKKEILFQLINQLKKMEFPHLPSIGNALLSLMELQSEDIAQLAINQMQQGILDVQALAFLKLIEIAITIHLQDLEIVPSEFYLLLPRKLKSQHMQVILHVLKRATTQSKTTLIHAMVAQLQIYHLNAIQKIPIDCFQIWAYLLEKNRDAAAQILNQYAHIPITENFTLLHFLSGCWIKATQSKEAAENHFSQLSRDIAPVSWALFSNFILSETSDQNEWLNKASTWEKNLLEQQVALYNHYPAFCG